MQRLQNNRRLFALAFVAAAAVAPALAAPAAAQQSTAGTAFKVIVKDLDNRTDPKSTKFGEKVSEAIRKGMSTMGTHTPIPHKDVLAELKRLSVDLETFDCTMARQLQTRMNAQVVMCGEYKTVPGGTEVSASFYTLEESISYDVLPFVAANEAEAASKIVSSFQTYVRQLQLASYCQSNVQAELWQDALTKCTEALQLNPRSTTSLYYRATALLRLGKPEEALAGYQAVLEISPIQQDAMRSAGSVAAQLGKSEMAMKYFRDYLQLNPGDEQVQLTIANDLNKGGNAVEAAKFLEEGLKGDTTNYAMMGAVGNYFMVAGSNLNKSTNTDAEKAEAKTYFNNALRYYEIINRHIEKANVSKNDLDNLYRYMMQAYQAVGQGEKALALGTPSMANDSVTAPTMLVYASILSSNGKQSEAIAMLDKAGAKDPTLKLAYQKALLSLGSGDLSDIVSNARKAAAEGTSDAEIDGIAMQIISEGSKKSGAAKSEWLEAGKALAKSDKPVAMVNFYQGADLYLQATQLIPKKPAVISKGNAERALGLLNRARPLIQSAGAFTEAASTRAQYLDGIDQTITYLKAIIKG